MELKDNCAVCRVSMNRYVVLRLVPCNHIIHKKCVLNIINAPEPSCPICRTHITANNEVVRKVKKGHTNQDRERIVSCANKGENWTTLAASLNINYKTAYTWVRSGRVDMMKKGGKKQKILSEENISEVVSWVEADCDLTLVRLVERCRVEFNKIVSTTTIANYLEGRLFSSKLKHYEPATMNIGENKRKRAAYVHALNGLIQQGKQVIWIDETNFNLFCRRSKGRAKVGDRAVQHLPASRGPNVHLIGAISAAGIVKMDRRRGSYTSALANVWLRSLLQHWQNIGNELIDLVVVVDNAPCHSSFETVVNETEATLLRLGPYSPMLNPIEIIWSKIKCCAKNNMRVPEVVAPGVMEQRLIYLEGIIDTAMNTIVGGDCGRAVQHCTSFHQDVLALNDMPVGQ